MTADETVHDLLVVGAGPTGIALGAEARRRDLDVLVVDAGALTAAILDFPTDMVFFTTRDKLEIVDVPFTITEEKPSRRQALRYYRAVAERYRLPLALHERVTALRPEGDLFVVATEGRHGRRLHRARTVALATGYFHRPRRLGVPGEDLPWVHHRYREPYAHHGEHVAIVGGGNSGSEAALDLWRNGARVTLVHRGAGLRPTVKYWLKPDVENRIEEGSIAALFATAVVAFEDPGTLRLRGADGAERTLAVDAAYVLVGYDPDLDLARSAGVTVDPVTSVPAFDPGTGESDVPGLYLVGTVRAGRDTNRVFIENSREHATQVADAVRRRLRP